ncbi:unnamed protein product [Clonostachys solani]|uniref:Uncharacterized protein n=1 Tax=Clonostachys solani TaxID=160281 RepID=A0A9N9ZJ94_9HYPO|nr:unnamed protein product [Clonostachys solani]
MDGIFSNLYSALERHGIHGSVRQELATAAYDDYNQWLGHVGKVMVSTSGNTISGLPLHGHMHSERSSIILRFQLDTEEDIAKFNKPPEWARDRPITDAPVFEPSAIVKKLKKLHSKEGHWDSLCGAKVNGKILELDLRSDADESVALAA